MASVRNLPPSLENTYDLRSSHRIECGIPCILVTLFNLKQYTGLIANINAGGCMCILSPISPGQAKILNIENKVLLEFDLPSGQGRKIFGEVANVKHDGAGVSLGIKFNDSYEDAALKELADYLLNMMKLPSA